ncbi:MAG: PP2C family serine/threonine-protein phosphatase [Sphaerospermopsis sp.]|nr:PP2C family serine/threonine-protein phosphatase [Sphaerospermopsis sp.]
MSKSEKELQELIQLFGWKLYLEPPSDEFKSKWEDFIQDQKNKDLVSKVCDSLLGLVQQSLNNRFGVNEQKISTYNQLEISEINKLWTEILDWLMLINDQKRDREEEIKLSKNLSRWKHILENKLKPKVLSIIEEVIKIHLEQKNKKTELLTNLDTPSTIKTSSGPIPPWQPEQETPIISTEKTPQNNPNLEETITPEKPKDEVTTPLGIWKYLPIPDNEPDKYDEYISKSGTSPEGLNLIAARVRGKMHKHNGTNCDDWFEFAVSGKWTIIAVADGAGSKKLSRIGAKISCEAAVKYLSESLANHQIKEGITHSELSTGEDINEIKNILHQAMQTAYQAVEDKAKDSQDSLRYFRLLDNREAEIKDFSATLLLAVHTTIKVEENNYNLILTCQVGDGMLAAISQAGTLKLLGKPDSGDYAGQTDFLTSKNKLETSNLTQKTFHFLGNLKCLMVMTDGVADDYFPNDPGMLELYGDLVLNQIINIDKPENSEINQQLLTTNLGSINSVREVKSYFQTPVERIIDPYLANEPDKILISSVADYAKELNRAVFEVVASPALLAAGIMDELMCEKCQDISPDEKLLIWLDSYYRKGSFDDRTLVVIY